MSTSQGVGYLLKCLSQSFQNGGSHLNQEIQNIIKFEILSCYPNFTFKMFLLKEKKICQNELNDIFNKCHIAPFFYRDPIIKLVCQKHIFTAYWQISTDADVNLFLNNTIF